MKTQAQLFTRALNKIGAVGSGQTASSEDVAIASGALAPLLAELATLEVCYIVISDDTAAEEIPDELFQGLATLLAMDIAAEFGQPAPTDEARQNAMNVLRRITAAKPTYEVLEAVYF
ncbi:adaptor protein [Pseudanabaena phage Pam5]|nr:adaptor protein [Pseudanabaena phage Pam5]